MKTLGTHNYYTYILTNKGKNVLYIGVTNNLKDRLVFHKSGSINSFTSRYRCFYLVYFEHYTDITAAIAREKQLKGWKRIRKIALIDSFNADWRFLNEDI